MRRDDRATQIPEPARYFPRNWMFYVRGYPYYDLMPDHCKSTGLLRQDKQGLLAGFSLLNAGGWILMGSSEWRGIG